MCKRALHLFLLKYYAVSTYCDNTVYSHTELNLLLPSRYWCCVYWEKQMYLSGKVSGCTSIFLYSFVLACYDITKSIFTDVWRMSLAVLFHTFTQCLLTKRCSLIRTENISWSFALYITVPALASYLVNSWRVFYGMCFSFWSKGNTVHREGHVEAGQ